MLLCVWREIRRCRRSQAHVRSLSTPIAILTSKHDYTGILISLLSVPQITFISPINNRIIDFISKK